MRYTLWKIMLLSAVVSVLIVAGAITIGRNFTPDYDVLLIRTHWSRGAWTKYNTLLDVSHGMTYYARDLLPCALDTSASPDGRLAVYQNCEGNTDTYILENGVKTPFYPVDNQGNTIVPIGSFEWSRTGKLLFLNRRSENNEVFVWDGLTVQNISQSGMSEYYPSWSADEKIAFVSEDMEIRVWTGAQVVTVAPNPARDSRPAWSPDGRLAFVSERDGNPEIYIWDGKRAFNISNSPADDKYPTWSAKGQLAFASLLDKTVTISIWEDGHITQTLSGGISWQVVDPFLKWSPDGRLAFTATRPSNGYGYPFGIDIWDGHTRSPADGYAAYGDEDFEAMEWINMRWK
jgi:Tol biopolymer transport system component